MTVNAIPFAFPSFYLEGQEPFSMFDDFNLEIGYIPPVHFKDKEEIKTIFDKQILSPAEEKHKAIREAKNK